MERYKGLSRAEWAEKLGLSYIVFAKKVAAVGFAEAIKAKYGRQARELGTYKGLTREQWADKLGLTINGFNQRVFKIGIEEAVKMPKRGGSQLQRTLRINGKVMSYCQFCKEIGMSHNTFYGWVRRLGIEEAKRKALHEYHKKEVEVREIKTEPAKFSAVRRALMRGLVKCHRTMEQVEDITHCILFCDDGCFDEIRV